MPGEWEEPLLDHLGIEETTATQAIITGDPERTARIAERLGESREMTRRRGLLCHEAHTAHGPILVVATGIGAPATAIVVEELAELGCHTIIRLGSCGAIQAHLRPGHLVVSTGCVRDEGTSRQYIDPSFPAVPDVKLTHALIDELSRSQLPLHFGITHCKDAYYLERPDWQLRPGAMADYWRTLRRAGVLVTEMESSTLFVLGSLRGLRTAGVFLNVGAVNEPGTLNRALDVAVDAIGRALEKVPAPSARFSKTPVKTAKTARSYLDREFYEGDP